jgi:DNA-binding NarL/FixJ family response regulator
MSTRVILVDDHRMVRQGLRALLEKNPGMEVVGEADDGRSAVELIVKLSPDVVVMDISMPELNGIEATRELKATAPGVKVIALSIHTEKQYVLGAIAAGASGYVAKTGAYEDLARAIEAAMAGKKYLSSEITEVVLENNLDGQGAALHWRSTDLGAREREVLQLLAEGYTSGNIAAKLHISVKTVDTHRRNLMRKLNLHSVADLTKYAIREGLTSLEP